jgi:serine protease Do
MNKMRVMSFFVSLSLVLTITLTALNAYNVLSSDDVSTSVSTTTEVADTTLVSTEVLTSLADVVASVTPSVVTIDTETTYQFFHRSFTQQGAGSGWIIDESGIIVTNNHVVAGADSIIVTLYDGRTFFIDPNTIATDPADDLAVIRIDAENLPAASIGGSSGLWVGDWVVAIGNPLGLGISAKEGIVSRLGVSLTMEGGTVTDLIETSAAINPGNSGGPLVDMRGEVIGITSAKVSSVGVEGLGYAISIDKAMPIIDELITSG